MNASQPPSSFRSADPNRSSMSIGTSRAQTYITVAKTAQLGTRTRAQRRGSGAKFVFPPPAHQQPSREQELPIGESESALGQSDAAHLLPEQIHTERDRHDGPPGPTTQQGDGDDGPQEERDVHRQDVGVVGFESELQHPSDGRQHTAFLGPSRRVGDVRSGVGVVRRQADKGQKEVHEVEKSGAT